MPCLEPQEMPKITKDPGKKSTLMLGEVKVASQDLEDSLGHQAELLLSAVARSPPHIT